MKKMKTYTAKFWRVNPQLTRGGYETTRTIEATTLKGAEKKAKAISEKCVYGGMQLLELTEAV